MPLTLQQLLTPTTEQQAIDGLLATLRELGFRTTSWQTGSIQLSLARAVARMAAGTTTVVRDIAAGGLLGLSKGAWLDLVAAWFGEKRQPAESAEGSTTWTNPISGSPQNILKGSLVQDTATLQLFQTTSPSTILAPGSTVTLTVSAVTPGRVGNVPLGSTLKLVTSYSGVTVSLKPLAAPNNDQWLSKQGADEETDDRLTRRLELRWSQLTYAVGFRAYEYWALSAAPSVTRVRILQNYPLENEIRVVLANDAGTATFAEVDAVVDYIDVDKVAINDHVTISAADVYVAAVLVKPRIRLGTSTIADVTAAILAVCNSMPIGGVRISGSVAGRLLRDQIITAIGRLNGVTSVGLETPATDLVLGGADIVVPSIIVEPEFFVGQE